MQKKLQTVGFDSLEGLKALGSKEAVARLKGRYPGTCVVIAYHLEAAIQGVEMKQLASACKAELRGFFNGL